MVDNSRRLLVSCLPLPLVLAIGFSPAIENTLLVGTCIALAPREVVTGLLVIFNPSPPTILGKLVEALEIRLAVVFVGAVGVITGAFIDGINSAVLF